MIDKNPQCAVDMLLFPTKNELETPRPAKDLLPWAIERINEIGATRDGKSILRLGKDRMVKMLAEEVLPIGIFAARHFDASSNVIVQPIDGNQNYDAVVTGDPLIGHIEITQAHEGELDHLRMLILERDGRVGVFDEITKSGTKKTGLVLKNEPQAKSHHEVVDEELTRILEAAQRKVGKQYPSDTALVIPFEDPAINDTSDVDLLDQFIHKHVLREAQQFCFLGVVGWVRHFYRGYAVG